MGVMRYSEMPVLQDALALLIDKLGDVQQARDLLYGDTALTRNVVSGSAIGLVLDAATGEYLFSIDSGTQNIITHIDPKTGAKTIDRSKWPDPNRPAVICPGVSGARAWPPTSYSPSSTFLYLPLTEWCNTFGSEGSKLLTSGVGLSSAEHPASADGMMGRVQALDVNGHKPAWMHRQASPISTSMLATAGGVVFGRSATQITYDISRALAKTWGPGDEVVVSRLDHDCNVRPWVQAAEARGATLRWLDFDPETAEIEPSSIEMAIGPRTRLVDHRALGQDHLAGRVQHVLRHDAVEERGCVALRQFVHDRAVRRLDEAEVVHAAIGR